MAYWGSYAPKISSIKNFIQKKQSLRELSCTFKKKFPPLPGLSYVSYWAKINRVCIGVLRSHIGGWIFDHGWQGLVGLQHNRAGLRNYIDWIGHTLCIGITTALSGAGWFNNNTLQHIIGWLLITGLGHHNFPIVCILISNNQS